MYCRSFFKKMLFLFLVSSVLVIAAPAHAYYLGDWNIDGYVKSQFGIFTEGKPFNDADNAYLPGSNDNIATARQQMRWNINGQLSRTIGIKAEVLAAWEPDYPGEKNTYQGGYGDIPANFYSSFDWRELTIEYKPSYSHTIRFGRQIINWGEAISGRVVDQCNPTDSRFLLGFTNLEETYMPLWMFRGIHDFYELNTSIEWIAAPIWQADRYEHERRMTAAGQRKGDGTFGTPWYRFAANPEGRVNRFAGADMLLSASSSHPGRYASVYGPPFATGYHGTTLLGSTTEAPLTPSNPYHAAVIGGYAAGAASVGSANMIWTEFPNTDGTYRSQYKRDYTDHNLKNTRWGLKAKHMLWGAEVGWSFYQGPAHSGMYRYKERIGISGPVGYLIYEYDIPRYNTFGLFGNYQTNFGMLVFEGAYKPSRQYHKNLFGLPAGTGANADWVDAIRKENIAKKDLIHTLLGLTREQNIPILNKYNVITIRAQWQAVWALENMDDVVETTTYWTKPERVNNEFLISLSTAYAYRKYSPGLTFVVNPRGQVYSSASFTWIPDGYNSRLSISAGYTNIWGANAYTTPTVLAAKNDLAVVTLKYNFY